MASRIGRGVAAVLPILAALAAPGSAQTPIVVGMIADMSGPTASTYAPVAQALTSYIDYANGRGLIGDRPIRIVVADSRSDPAGVAAIAKTLIEKDRAVLLIKAGLSSLYPAVVEESRNARVPIYFAGGVCPKETYPPADPLQFCSTGFAATLDSRAALQFVKSAAKEPVKIGLAAMAIPIARAELDVAEKLAATLGFSVAGKETAPPQTADYAPLAETLRRSEPNWVYSWSPWVAEVKIAEALRRQGWAGHYIAWAHNEAEDELARLKDEKFFVIGANALFRDEEPIHTEIRAIAGHAKFSVPVTQSVEGFIAGLVVAEIFRNVESPTPARVLAAMNNLAVDMRGLRGGPLVWTKDNHFRTRQHYRVWRWDNTQQKIVRAQDWVSIDVKQ
jgi:ABC-type branched-subunit amino acid transport system substrate-binding protein